MSEGGKTGGRWGFAHVPALDGLRGLAVAGVLTYHLGHLTGGYLGVDLFFVLSGYLITSLLLAERAGTGTIALGAFWGRRVRRLMPALLLLMVGVAAYAHWIARPVDLEGIRADGLATLAYVANWHTIWRGSSYWDISLAPSPLQHVWSLAIEEQFYLVWPLLFAALARRVKGDLARTVQWVALGGAAVSAALFVGLHHAGASDTRVYEGTDTRAAALLLGVALAGWWRRRNTRLHPADTWHDAADPREAADLADVVSAAADTGLFAADADADANAPSSPVAVAERPAAVADPGPSLALEAVGLAAGVLLAGMWLRLDGQSQWLYRGGLPVASLLAVVLLAAAADPRSPVLGRALSFSPLRWLGAISYGLYLWHWPIYQALDLRNGNYPFLGDLELHGRVLVLAKVGLSLLAAVLSYFLVEMPIRRGRWLRGRAGTSAAVGGIAMAALLIVTATAGAVSVPGPGTKVVGEAKVKVAKAPTVLFVGDSVAQAVVRPVIGDPVRYGVNPVNRTYPGCNVISQGRRTKSFVGTDSEPAACFRNLDTELTGIRPDVTFLLIGSRPNDSVEIDGEFRRACDPAYDAAYVADTRRFVRRLRGTGAPVVIGTVARSGAQAIPVEGSEDRIACVNRSLAEVVRAEPGTTLVDLNELVCPGTGPCKEELDGHPLRSDGLHYDDGPGGALVADWVVERVLRDAKLRAAGD